MAGRIRGFTEKLSLFSVAGFMVLTLAACSSEPLRLRVETTPEAMVSLERNGKVIPSELGSSRSRIFRVDFDSLSAVEPYVVTAKPAGSARALYRDTKREVTRRVYLTLPYRDESDRGHNIRLLHFDLDENVANNPMELSLTFENVRRVWNDAGGGGTSVRAVPAYDEWIDIRTGVEDVLRDMLVEKGRVRGSSRLAGRRYDDQLSILRSDVQGVIDQLALARGKQTGRDINLPGTDTHTRLFTYEVSVPISSLKNADEISEAIARFGNMGRKGSGGQNIEFMPVRASVTYSSNFLQAGITMEATGFAPADSEVYIIPEMNSAREVLVKKAGPTVWKQPYRLSPGQNWIYGYVLPVKGRSGARYFRINVYDRRQESISEETYRTRPQTPNPHE